MDNAEEIERRAQKRKEIVEKNREHFREFVIHMDEKRKKILELMRRRHAYYTKLINEAEVKTAKDFYEKFREHFDMYGVKLSLGDLACSIYLELGDYDYEQYWVMDGKNGNLAEVCPEVAFKDLFTNLEVNIFTEEYI